MSRCCLVSLPRIPARQCPLYPPRLSSQRCGSHTDSSSRIIAQTTNHTPPTVPQFVAPPTVLEKSKHTTSTTVPGIRILCRVFSVSNITCREPATYPIRTLRELYHGAHTRGTLNDLSGPQFSAIISLFGTLSVHDPPSQFMSPLAHHMDGRRNRAWWGFIFQMVRDKKRVMGFLNEGDLYWLLRARASEASLTGLNVYAGDSVSNPRLLAARERYLTLDVKTAPADDYVPYLKALLSIKVQDATAEVVAWLCYLMKRDIYCPSSLLGVLWECVLDANNLLSDDLKEKILGLISQRLTLPADFSEDARNRFASLLPEPEVDDPEKLPSFCLTASDLAHEVVRILFPRVTPSLSGTPSQLAIQEWAHSETQRMFSPSARLEFRWHNLVCLAIATTRSPTYTQAMVPTLLRAIRSPRLSAVNFKLVAVLALVERIATSHGSSTDLHSSVRDLWRSWADIANNDSHAHRALVRPILGTFFRLAALTRDASLVHSCVRLASVGFWQFDLGDDVARRQAQLLAVEYLAAAAVSGDSLWERIVIELPPHITFPQWHSMLLSKTILRLVRLDAQRAVDMYHLWRRYLPLPDLSASLGPMLVQEGRVDLAIPMLSDISFTGPSLGAVLQPLAKQGSWYIDLELAAIIAKALHVISGSEAPPQTTPARRYVAWALLALVCSAQARAAVTIFKNVYTRDPGFFNGRVHRTFLSMLLRHRQFRGAAEIAKLSRRLRWRHFVLFGLARRGSTPRVEAQLGGSLLPKWLVDVVARTRLGRRHPAAGLLRRWAMRRARTPADSRSGMKVLVRARGVGLATRAYRTARTVHNAGEQTALGNIILDGQVTHAQSRGPRYLKSVMRTLRLLVEEHGFVPDRVTTNIVVKAALRAHTVLDVVLVRRLFDYFAWSGYGGGVSFGSSDAAMREAAAVLGTCTPVTESRLSFARHVKPLYKMFIKALFLRKDVAGARRVVGVLKEAERLEVERIARRRKTRRIRV
ncbi:hypothetical protein EDB83DRAFT_2263052 [Lactarius deliciosus]|nr:hypothetical protein EDB83DRAFT_2263052 [Lactarius deliciosus]